VVGLAVPESPSGVPVDLCVVPVEHGAEALWVPVRAPEELGVGVLRRHRGHAGVSRIIVRPFSKFAPAPPVHRRTGRSLLVSPMGGSLFAAFLRGGWRGSPRVWQNGRLVSGACPVPSPRARG